jgi:propionyl-CoA synthetase
VFEGKPVGTPDAGTFWRVIAEHKVKALFTAPTAFRAIKRDDPKAGSWWATTTCPRSSRCSSPASAPTPTRSNWAQKQLGVPVIDHWWQTETGWAIAGNPMGIEPLPVKIGSPTVAMPGYDVQILDEGGHPGGPGELGAIAVKLPLPPGTLPTLWNAEERFARATSPISPATTRPAMPGMIDEDGYLYIMARTDDVINVAGHRLSTGAMEEVLAGAPGRGRMRRDRRRTAEGPACPWGSSASTAAARRDHDAIAKECVKLVRDRSGRWRPSSSCTVVDRLPKTRSGKILRGTMVKIADGESYKMPATIDDPAILDEIGEALSIGASDGPAMPPARVSRSRCGWRSIPT